MNGSTAGAAPSRLLATDVSIYRGASLSCPPFCPGALGSNVVPSPSDAEGRSFVLASTDASNPTGALPRPLSVSLVTSSLGLYYAPACAHQVTSAYTDSMTCADPSNQLSFGCAYGSGASCQVSSSACALIVCVLFTFAIRQACPEGALCPGGSRLWTRPGYWTPTDGGVNGGSGGASTGVVACRLPDATARCLGWNVHDGATRCGAGYLPESYRCSACVPGYFHTSYGSCDPCPLSYTKWERYSVIGGLCIGVTVVILFVSVIVVAMSWFRGDSLSKRALRAAELVCWALTSAQVRLICCTICFNISLYVYCLTDCCLSGRSNVKGPSP